MIAVLYQTYKSRDIWYRVPRPTHRLLVVYYSDGAVRLLTEWIASVRITKEPAVLLPQKDNHGL